MEARLLWEQEDLSSTLSLIRVMVRRQVIAFKLQA